MESERYLHDTKILQEFFTLYCNAKHADAKKQLVTQELFHDGIAYGNVTAELCSECEALHRYAHAKLSTCKLHPKPKCRTCKVRCYEKTQWKAMAKVMRYAGMQMGAQRVKELIFSFKSAFKLKTLT